MKRVAIVGSRIFENYPLLEREVKKIIRPNEIEKIVSGGAKGADSLAEKFADKYGIEKQIFIPEWNRYGNRAGFVRNKKIVENADIVIAFWNGKSSGTENTIETARFFHKELHVIKI